MTQDPNRITKTMRLNSKLQKLGVDLCKMPFQEWESTGEIPKDWKPKKEWKIGYRTQKEKVKIAREYAESYYDEEKEEKEQIRENKVKDAKEHMKKSFWGFALKKY